MRRLMPFGMPQKGQWIIDTPGGLDEKALAVNAHPVGDVSRVLCAFIVEGENAAHGMEIGVWRLFDAFNVWRECHRSNRPLVYHNSPSRHSADNVPAIVENK